MKSPATLVAHLAEHLPAAWAVAEMPRGMRRRYGAWLTVGDCHLYVAATRSAVDVVATAASLALDPAAAPEWAKVTT